MHILLSKIVKKKKKEMGRVNGFDVNMGNDAHVAPFDLL